MTTINTAFAQGTHAAKPAAAAGNNGYYYFETDTGTLWQSTGSAWVQVAASTQVGQLVRATRSTTQSIPSAANTAVSFDAAPDLDWAGWASGSPTRVTILTAGTYVVSACAQWSGSGTSGSRRLLILMLNGSTELSASEHWFLTGAFPASSLTITKKFAANDYVELVAYVGAGTDSISTFVVPYLEASRLS